jgi:hypothetical protein
MATDQHFQCPNRNCGMWYRATHEQYPTHKSSRFVCLDCRSEVLAWDGKRGDYLYWTPMQMKSVRMGNPL